MTLDVSHVVFEILTHLALIYFVFTTTPLSLTPHSGGTHCDINVIYTPLESTFNGLQFRRWQYGFTFIRLAVFGSQICEIRQNSERIWPWGSSRSSKVIDLGVNRKRIYDFLILLVSRRYGHYTAKVIIIVTTIVTKITLAVFQILTFKSRKWLVFPTPP